MKYIRLYLLIFLCMSAYTAEAQLLLKYADYKYRILNYPDAIPYYEYYLSKKDSNNIIAVRNLANCYRLTNQSHLSEKYYKKLILTDTLEEDKIRYIEDLLRNGKYILAENTIRNSPFIHKQDERIRQILHSIEFGNQLYFGDTANIKTEKLSFNTEESDYAPFIINADIIFASSRRPNLFISRKHTWTENNYVSLFRASASDGYIWVQPFAEELRRKYNFGPGSYSEKDHTLYYTINSRRKKTNMGYKNLRIESAVMETHQWKEIYRFTFNEPDYAFAHPSVNKEGTELYFSSNMPGGYGGMDIYRCALREDSTWSHPVNLGLFINSKGDELFPYISAEGNLYFASNGKGGLGGLDIFYSAIHSDNKQALNLGAPFNSSSDDFGIALSDDETKGFFSSNRGNNGIDDDIYSFERIRKNIQLNVIDSLSGETVSNVSLQISYRFTHTDHFLKEGKGNFTIAENGRYLFLAEAPLYSSKHLQFALNFKDSIVHIPLSRLQASCNVSGTVYKKGTEETIDSVSIQIRSLNTGEQVYAGYTEKGKYRHPGLKSNTKYLIRAGKEHYFSREVVFSTNDYDCLGSRGKDFDYIKDITLEEIVIGKAIQIENIYFDLNKWNIRADAAKELDKIVKMMNDNPGIIIELSSHTDSRGSASSNELLSDRRAKSSAAYIVSKGIDSSRITGKGYGEYRLVNSCADGIKCSEKAHQENRRTEFTVIGLKQ